MEQKEKPPTNKGGRLLWNIPLPSKTGLNKRIRVYAEVRQNAVQLASGGFNKFDSTLNVSTGKSRWKIASFKHLAAVSCVIVCEDI